MEPATTTAPQTNQESVLGIRNIIANLEDNVHTPFGVSRRRQIAPDAVLALALGAVEAGVGGGEQLLGRPRLRIGGDAEAGGDRDRVAAGDRDLEARGRLAEAL